MQAETTTARSITGSPGALSACRPRRGASALVADRAACARPRVADAVRGLPRAGGRRRAVRGVLVATVVHRAALSARGSGIPFVYDPGPGILSMQAIADPPAYQRARAAVRYDEVARTLVHALKFQDRVDLAPVMGRWMARAAAPLLADADLLVPVPLHWRRGFSPALQPVRRAGA